MLFIILHKGFQIGTFNVRDFCVINVLRFISLYEGLVRNFHIINVLKFISLYEGFQIGTFTIVRHQEMYVMNMTL